MYYLSYLNILVVSTFNIKAVGNHHIIKGVVNGISEALLSYTQKVTVDYCFVENVIWKVKCFQPALVLFLGPSVREDVDFGSIATYLRSENIKTVFWITDDPYEFDSSYRYYKFFDFIFTNDLGTLPYYFNVKNIQHLPLAASVENDYRDINAETKDIDLFFCGYPYKNRKIIIEELCKYIRPETLVLSTGDWGIKDVLYVNIDDHQKLIDTYARCKYVLNIGRTYNIANEYFSVVATTPGPRTFEAALAGAAQIYISNGMEIENYYDLNGEIILSHNVQEVAQIVQEGLLSKQYLTMAKVSQDKTLSEHLYVARVKKIFEFLREDCL